MRKVAVSTGAQQLFPGEADPSLAGEAACSPALTWLKRWGLACGLPLRASGLQAKEGLCF